jgi:hypothetical protein
MARAKTEVYEAVGGAEVEAPQAAVAVGVEVRVEAEAEVGAEKGVCQGRGMVAMLQLVPDIFPGALHVPAPGQGHHIVRAVVVSHQIEWRRKINCIITKVVS